MLGSMGADCSGNRRRGFTLIELSIVLVIIGLIVGGILVGQNLISAAAVRAQITQIEKFNTAVNTFRTKYDNYLPGDIIPTEAAQFGLASRTGAAGQGDGNGIIGGPNSGMLLEIGISAVLGQGGGETGLFWVDLSTASLIEGSFSTATAILQPSMTNTTVSLYMPQAKLGTINYIYVYTDGTYNWFGFSGVTKASSGALTTTASITPLQAYGIDSKIDDGFPASGKVVAQYLSYARAEAADLINTAPAASPAVSGDCYDSTTTQGAYAVQIDGGADTACALSFKFQ
jgi:prepilin-type N-terminal cleavage/methylation domain-containing protein